MTQIPLAPGLDPFDGASGWECFVLFLRRLPHWALGDGELFLDEIQIMTFIFVGISAALIGSLLVLRRQAMLANSLAHTVLCGIVLAFGIERFFTGAQGELGGALSVKTLWLSAGAAALLTSWLTKWAQRHLRLAPESSVALVFSSLFALGVLLVSLLAQNAHIGIEVIMGNADALLPRDALIALIVCCINVPLCVALRKEHAMTAFDPQFSFSVGVRTKALDFCLTLQTALTMLCAFRSVGSFLVLAWLSGLPIIALIWAKSLEKLWIFATGIALALATISVCLTRHLLTVSDLPLSTSGMSVALLVGLQLLLFGLRSKLVGIKLKPEIKLKG